jgi:hypothetical protein
MAEAALNSKKDIPVYDFRVFVCLRELLTAVSTNTDGGVDRIFADLKNPVTKEFLESRGFSAIWDRFQRQYKTRASLLNAFHRWFDGFVTLKYIHSLTEKVWPRQSLKDIHEANIFRDDIA